MGRVDFTGLPDFEARLARHERAATEAVPEMLAAGAQVLAEAEKASIRKYDLIDKGALIKSVKPTKVKKKGSQSSVEVYPQGRNKKGERNATVGFVQEYGYATQTFRKNGSRAIGIHEPTPWHSEAVEKSRDEVQAAMDKVWKEKTQAE